MTLLAGLMCRGAEPADNSLTLVKDGKPNATIVVPWLPNKAAQFAAKELQYHVKLITGAELSIVNENQSPITGNRILIGASKWTKELGLDESKFKTQEYMVEFHPNTLVLMGEDEQPDPYRIKVWQKYETTNGHFGKAWARAYGKRFDISDHGFSDDAGTYEVWVHGGTNGNSGGELLSIEVPGSGQSLAMIKGLTYTTWNGDSRNVIESKDWPFAPTWHHLMVTWDAVAAKQEMFLDGKSIGSSKYEKTRCASAETLGTGIMCWGPLDELRLSDVVRKPEEGGPKAAFKPDEHTKLLIHFDDPKGPSDDSGRWMPDPMPDIIGKHATEYAVYDFIEKYLGVRWYFPTELGMVFTKTNTLTVSGANIRRSPAMQFRNHPSIYGLQCYAVDEIGGAMGRVLCNNPSEKERWLFCHRNRAGGRMMAPNHSFHGYAARFLQQDPANPGSFEASHPEYFAVGREASGTERQLCYTSPDVIAQVVKDAKEYFATGSTHGGANVGADYFSVCPLDTQDQCLCTNCQAQLHMESNAPFANGDSSELVWNFTAKIAREIQKEFPDKFIAQNAYHDYSMYPSNVDLPSNLIVGPCLGTRTYCTLDPATNREVRQYKEWIKKGIPKGMDITVWLYQCFPTETGAFNKFHPFPGFHGHMVEKSMKMFTSDGVKGIALCGIAEYVDQWLTYQYANDPKQDVDKLLNEFFDRFYGPAAEPMKKFYLLVEKQWSDPKNRNCSPGCEYQFSSSPEVSWENQGNAAVMKQLGEYMAEAKKLATTDEQKRRIALFDEAVWQFMLQGQRDYQAKQPYPLRFFNGIDHIPGKFGNAYKFNFSQIGVHDPHFSDQSGTFECWVVGGEGNTGGNIFMATTRNHTSGHSLAWNDKKRWTYSTWKGGATNSISAKELIPDGWHHLAVTWDAATSKQTMYLDGKQIATGKYAKTAAANVAMVSFGGTANYMWCDIGMWSWGAIDEVRLSNCVRKPVVGGQTAPYTADDHTLVLLHLDENGAELPKWGGGKAGNGKPDVKTK